MDTSWCYNEGFAVAITVITVIVGMDVRWQVVAKSVVLFIALLVLWPNLIHEPLHMLALQMQGSSGTIGFDWSVPAHPTTTRTAPVAGLAGGFLFLLLPSAVSLILLIVLLRIDGWWTAVVGAYLGFDLIINVWKYQLPFSDWRFLVAVPGGWLVSAILAGLIMVLLSWNVLQEVLREQ